MRWAWQTVVLVIVTLLCMPRPTLIHMPLQRERLQSCPCGESDCDLAQLNIPPRLSRGGGEVCAKELRKA